jgi:hypothetical protein
MGPMLRMLAQCFALILVGCQSEPDCLSNTLEKTRDPDSDLFATTELWTCNIGTTDYTVVRVGKVAEPDEAEEVFRAGFRGPASGPIVGPIWMSVGWTQRRTLSISYQSDARVLRQVRNAMGAKINLSATYPLAPILLPTPRHPPPIPYPAN